MDNSLSATEIHVTPTLLMFLAPNFALGGLFAYQYDSFEVGDYSLSKVGLGPLAVGVFDAQDERAAQALPQQIVVDGGACAAHVQKPRRRGGEAHPDRAFEFGLRHGGAPVIGGGCEPFREAQPITAGGRSAG